MKRFRLAKPLFLLALLSTIVCCVACSETIDPTIIDITPDFSAVDLPNPANTDFDLSLLNSPNRCKPYATIHYNRDRGAEEYAYIGDTRTLFRYKRIGTYSDVIDFYWYGYAGASDERITLIFNPHSDQPIFSVTASRNGQTSATIYKSTSYQGLSLNQPIELSPGYKVEVFTREQFADAVTNGSLPEAVVAYDTPADADYICKASFQITYT